MSSPGNRTRSYEYFPPFTDFAQVAHLDGLELMQHIMRGEISPPPISATLGFQLVEVERGRALFEGKAEEWQYNPIGTVHGGWSSTLLDSALGCAVHSALSPGDLYTTLDLHVRFLRPVLATSGVVRAEGRLIHLGKRIATAEARLFTTSGSPGGTEVTVHATATASCLISRQA